MKGTSFGTWVFLARSFGVGLQEAREAEGLTQQDVAEVLGVAHQEVSLWEGGGCELLLDSYLSFCFLFDLNPFEYLMLSSEM